MYECEPSIIGAVVMADTVNQFKNRLDKHWANCVFLYDYLVNYNGTGSLFVVQKKYENLDVDSEAIACVHSLQYSTVQSCIQLTTLLLLLLQLLKYGTAVTSVGAKKLLPVRTGLVAKSITSPEMFRYSMAASCSCALLAVHAHC